MNLLESWNELTESLKKPFYSHKEARLDTFKDSSQIIKPSETEDTSIYYDPFSGYSNSMLQNSNAVATYNDFVKKWREVSCLPEVDQAIQEISSEAIVFDEIDEVIELNLDNIELPESIKTKIKDSFAKIMYLLDFNEKGEELFRQWYIDATLNLEVVYNNRKPKDGIQKLILLSPYNIFKFKNEKTSEIKWYINSKQTYNILKDINNSEKSYYDEQIVHINSGLLSPDKKFYHSFLQKAIKPINQLYLLEDSLVIMRMSKSVEKRAFYVDTGNLPKSKAEEYMRNLITKYRQKKVYNTEKGTIENQNKTISVLEDFWFPVNSTSRGTRVENLQGVSNNFTSFDDVNYFIDKVYNALQIPATRRNKESRLSIGSNIDIERDEIQFFKFILKLRRRFNNMFVDLLKKDIISRQIMTLRDWNKIQEKIKFIYANSNEISLIKKMQITQIKMDSAASSLSMLQDGIISKKYIQKYILELTDDEIKEIDMDIMTNDNTEVDALGNPSSNTPDGEEQGYEEISNDEVNPDSDDSDEKITPVAKS
ncbi:hypothetical protein GW796_05640 [archaeon]|nr:hypothetical protein [archaeon]NCQ51367.1 hypothetical protein [archaeon]NCT58807.1 hypothetical protein [archaeon]